MENFDFDDNVDFRLTDEEGKKNIKRFAMVGLYTLLAVVVMVTGAHAIMLVMAQAPAEIGAENSLLAKFLNAIRITFPIVVEAAAVVAGLGFIGAKWRKGQKTAAFMIELVWVIFAAANMITFFRIERGLALETWQVSWVDYGLPLSALVAGILTYALTRTDPDLKRKDEETAAEEKIKAIKFSSRRDVAISAERMAIEKQRAWIDFIKKLQTQGYSDQQIRFMLQGVPDLLVDGDGDGRMDLLESGDGAIPGTARPVHQISQKPYGAALYDVHDGNGERWVFAGNFQTRQEALDHIKTLPKGLYRIVFDGHEVYNTHKVPKEAPQSTRPSDLPFIAPGESRNESQYRHDGATRPTPAPRQAQANGRVSHNEAGLNYPNGNPYSPE